MSDPLVTVVVVYNDADALATRLQRGLERQYDVEWDLVAVDNREGRYASAVAALHDGASRARGRWLVFAHQDVELLAETWLRDAVSLLEPMGDLGWAGVAGVDEAGCFRGLLVDAGMVRGISREGVHPVQTLDECLLMTRSRADGRYFDVGLEGWHVYGVDACLDALREGRRNVALPLPVWHDSKGTNLDGLQDARRWLVSKHGESFPTICTTTGALPEGLDHPQGRPGSLAKRLGRRLRAEALRAGGWSGGYRVWLGELLEEATRDRIVDVFRPRGSLAVIEARGFVHQPVRPHSVRHLFGGAVDDVRTGAQRVVWHDRMAASVDPAGEVVRLAGNDRTLVVVDVLELRRRPGVARALRVLASERTLAVDLDGRKLAVYRVEGSALR